MHGELSPAALAQVSSSGTFVVGKLQGAWFSLGPGLDPANP